MATKKKTVVGKSVPRETGTRGSNPAFAAFVNFIERTRLGGALGSTFGGQRDVYGVLGYANEVTYDQLRFRYARGGIAKRIVDAPAKATWRKKPTVVERRRKDQERDKATPFEKAWTEVVEKHKLFTVLERLDKQAGVGKYSGMFVGFNDTPRPSEPLTQGFAKGPQDLLYVSALPEPSLDIREYETDPSKPSFGQVKLYELTYKKTSKDIRSATTKSVVNIKPQIVHASRVIHVAEGTYEDDVFGSGRLQHVYNYLDDIEKVVGGASELFWRAAWGGIQADLRDGHTMSAEDEAALSDEIEKYIHQMERVLKTKGIDIKAIGSTFVDPAPTARMLIDLISGATEIPQRILVGSERGELSSTQDESNWNNRVSERQTSFAEPFILKPLIDMLIYAGVLPKPRLGYDITWSDLTVLTPADRGEYAGRMGQALQRYADAALKLGNNIPMTVEEFRQMVLDVSPDRPQSDYDLGEGDPNNVDKEPPDDGDQDSSGDK